MHGELREFSKYVSLNVMGMIGLSCYILADTFFVANGVGADGLAALNLAIPIYSFVHGSGLMIGVGGATKYAVLRSRDNKEDADKVFGASVVIGIVVALLFMMTGLLLPEKIAGLVGAEGNVFEMTNTYIKVILLFAPAFMLNDIFICFVRNDKNPSLAMAAMVSGSMSNIVLDYILIYPFKMGILGAVLATGIAPVISMAILSMHLKRKEHFEFAKADSYIRQVRQITALGVPSLITEVASGVVMMVFNFLILSAEGNIGVAAYGIIANISLVVISIYTGIAQGMQPLASRAFGSGREPSKLLKYAVVTTLALSAVVYCGVFVFAGPIAAAFNGEHNEALQQMAETGLRLYFTAMPFAGLNIIFSMFFTATERPVPAQIISLLRGIILIVPIAFAAAYIGGLMGIWLALAVTELLVLLVALGLYTKRKSSLEVR